MTPRRINSPHAKNISGSFEIDKDDNLVRVLTVETDLRLDVLDPAHDKEEVNKLLAALRAGLGDLYDRADLKQTRGNA